MAGDLQASRGTGGVIGMDDRLLLSRHLRGDPQAFPALVALLGGPVLSTLRRLGVRHPDCDELFQDVFVKVHGAAHTYQADRALRPWVLTIAVNVARSWHRRQKVRSLVLLDGGEAQDRAPASAVDPHRDAEAAETARWLQASLEDLPGAHREALVLVTLEGLSLADAASALDLPVSTVKTHLRRARLELAQGLVRRRTTLEREAT